MDLPRESEIATARRLVVLVGLAYLVIQLVLFSFDRPPSWDEAIYLSQVEPGADALAFTPSRARGITVLAIPVLQLGGSLSILRTILAVGSALALTGAFRMWAPVIGFGTVAAAILFAGAWPTLFYGSELMPNLWVALIAVAATAVLARRLARGEGRSDELVAGGLVAVAALFRPLDAVVVTAALVLVPLVFRRATWSWVGFLLLGLAVGWAPWLVEMTVRFGSLRHAFAVAARYGHTRGWSPVENGRQYLALSDGPSRGPVAHPDVPISGVLWLVGLLVLLVIGFRAANRCGFVPSLVVPAATGLALAAEYLLFVDAQAPRFLLPAFALFAIPAGLGLSSIVVGARARDPGRVPRVPGGVVAAVLVGAWLLVQLQIAARVEDRVTRQRASAVRVGLQIRSLAARQPCFVHSDVGFPIIAYTAGCRAAELGELGTWSERADRLASERAWPFLVLQRSEEPEPPDGAVLVRTVSTAGERTWYVYERG